MDNMLSILSISEVCDSFVLTKIEIVTLDKYEGLLGMSSVVSDADRFVSGK